MDTFQEHNPKQASHTKSTIEEVKEWDVDDLLKWIHQERPGLLNNDNLEKFKAAFINKNIFVDHAGDVGFFENKCKLPIGISESLAKLAREAAGGETAGMAQKGNRQQAEDVDMLSDISSQPKQIADERICQRTHTVIRLAEILEEQRVILVRGTPSSGKTILSRLLRDYFENCGDNVVFIRGWRTKGKTAANYLTSRCSRAGYPGIRIDDYGDANIIFIIDEAQQSYSDISLWDFIKEKIGRREGPKFCLFSSYGSPSQGMVKTAETESYTPPFLGPMKRVSLTCATIKGSPDVCLFYNDLEFKDVVERFCKNPVTRLKMDKAAQTYLFKITNGHPGAVASMLDYIFKTYGSDFKKGNIQQITEDHLIKSLENEAAVFSHLENTWVYRSFPKQHNLTPHAVDVLKKVLLHRTLDFNIDDKGMKLCFKMGWIHVDAMHSDGSDQQCFLPSRLHEKFIEYFLTSTNPKPFPINEFPTLPELCKEVFKHFSKSSLLVNSAGRATVEAQYQDEFYRVFKTLLGNNVGISSEWARGTGGRIDFRILGPKWGVEFLVDGTRTKLSEHYGRFQRDGQYYWWISQGFIRDWLVIDCRCSRPGRTTPSWSKLWHAVFAEDFSTVRIVDAGDREIMPKVCLMN